VAVFVQLGKGVVPIAELRWVHLLARLGAVLAAEVVDGAEGGSSRPVLESACVVKTPQLLIRGHHFRGATGMVSWPSRIFNLW
jgi:hypothetical protein